MVSKNLKKFESVEHVSYKKVSLAFQTFKKPETKFLGVHQLH
jgi:hypothetical protein